ncbi:hypothetical protein BC832DRAFT_386669 [Gaertneriomyces semiglobifer]|nr:hypothetical protein BC832DRAFT_386669 [Gaertneriomyces semiglobifer]
MLPPAKRAVDGSIEAVQLILVFIFTVLGPTLTALLNPVKFVRARPGQSLLTEPHQPTVIVTPPSTTVASSHSTQTPYKEISTIGRQHRTLSPKPSPRITPTLPRRSRSPATYLPAANDRSHLVNAIIKSEEIPLPLLRVLDVVDSSSDWVIDKTAEAVVYCASFFGFSWQVAGAADTSSTRGRRT